MPQGHSRRSYGKSNSTSPRFSFASLQINSWSILSVLNQKKNKVSSQELIWETQFNSRKWHLVMSNSSSDEGKKTPSPQPPNDLWLICPVCKQPNPAGTAYCSHCWGASLNSVKPMTSEEVEDFNKQRLKRTKRRRIFRIALIVLIPVVILLGAGFLYIYSYTDILFGPVTQMNSNSLPSDWAMFRHDLNRSGSRY